MSLVGLALVATLALYPPAPVREVQATSTKARRLANLREEGSAAVAARQSRALMLKVAQLRQGGQRLIEEREARLAALDSIRINREFAERHFDMRAAFRAELEVRPARAFANRLATKWETVAEARVARDQRAMEAMRAWEEAERARRRLERAESRLAELEAEAEGAEATSCEAFLTTVITFQGRSFRVFLATDATTDQLEDEAQIVFPSLAATPVCLWVGGERLPRGAPLSAVLQAGGDALLERVMVTPLGALSAARPEAAPATEEQMAASWRDRAWTSG